jgi:hypothetical protein
VAYREPTPTAPRRTRSTILIVGFAALLLSLIGAGCSSPPAKTSTSTSTSGTDGSGGGSGGNNKSPTRDTAVKFAECMRKNGVREFPDPDASGQLTIDGVLNGSSLDPSTAAWKKAVSACKALEPPGFTGHKRSAQQQEAALKFAQCIRGNGVKDFPDPTPDGPLIDTGRIPSLAGKDPRSHPGLNAAMQKCRDFASSAGVTGGQ